MSPTFFNTYMKIRINSCIVAPANEDNEMKEPGEKFEKNYTNLCNFPQNSFVLYHTQPYKIFRSIQLPD